jgi:predicted permease
MAYWQKMGRSPIAEPWYLTWFRDARQDLPHAVRQLRRTPGVTSLIVLTLAIGIGANVTMAGLIDRLLLRPPAHVQDADRVARLLFTEANAPADARVGTKWSYPAMLDLQREAPALEQVAAYADVKLPLGSGPDAQDVRASLVSPSFFPLFGVRPFLGRLFSPPDGYPTGDGSGGPPLAVISYGFWQRQFGGDSTVIGRDVRIGVLPYTIVGVTPRGFQGVDVEPPDVWLPVSVAGEADVTGVWRSGRATVWLAVVARLRQGASRALAAQQATAIWRQFNAPPGTAAAQRRVVAASVIPGRGPDAPREVKVALWLGGVSALVLLIACANVANLLLARAFTRRREIAVRLALGAGRGRLARQMLAEAGLLAVLSGTAALLLAVGSGRVLARLFVSDISAAGSPLDLRLLAFAATIALGTGVLISLAPLLQSTRPDLTTALRAGAAAGGGRTSRVRTGLLGAQAALCMLMLVVAGLFAQSLRRVEGLDLGVDVDHTLNIYLTVSRLALTEEEVAQIYRDMQERVRAVPGVRDVALASWDPFSGGRAVAAHTQEHDADYYWHPGVHVVPAGTAVDSGFFRTIGAVTLRGRDFTSADVLGAPNVAIINEPLAEILWPGEDALGRCVYLPVKWGQPVGCTTVVGVLPGYLKRSVLSRDGLAVYFPLAQHIMGVDRPGSMVVGVSIDPSVVLPAVRHAIMSVRPDMPPVRIVPMRDVVDPEYRPWRVAATMFSIFGAVALLIATIGLYAVVSFTAAQRSAEIAVRIALGARARNILAAVAGDGLRTITVGLTVGLIAALAIRHWIGPLLFQTSPSDPGIIAGVAVLLLAVAVVATLVPTARALRRNPAAVLRVD